MVDRDFNKKIKIGKLELPLWALIFGIGLAILLIAAALAVFFWRRRRNLPKFLKLNTNTRDTLGEELVENESLKDTREPVGDLNSGATTTERTETRTTKVVENLGILDPNIITIENIAEDDEIEEFFDIGTKSAKNLAESRNDNDPSKPKKLGTKSSERAILEKFVKFDPFAREILEPIAREYGLKSLPENLRSSVAPIEETREIVLAIPKTGPVAITSDARFEFNAPERGLGIIGSAAGLILVQFTTFKESYINVPYNELFMNIVQKMLPSLLHENQEVLRIHNIRVNPETQVEKNIQSLWREKEIFLVDDELSPDEMMRIAQEVREYLTENELAMLNSDEFIRTRYAKLLIAKTLGLYYLHLDYAKHPNTKILPDPINKEVFWVHEEFFDSGILRKRQIRLFIGKDGMRNCKIYSEKNIDKIIDDFYKAVPKLRIEFEEKLKKANEKEKGDLLYHNKNYAFDPVFKADLDRPAWGNKDFKEKYGDVDQSDVFTSKDSVIVRMFCRNTLLTTIHAMFYVAYKFMHIGKRMEDKEFSEALRGGLENFARAAFSHDVAFYECWDIFMRGVSDRKAPEIKEDEIAGISCGTVISAESLALNGPTIKAIREGVVPLLSLAYEGANPTDQFEITSA